MATGKVVLREIIQFMAGYTPVYPAIYPLFLGKSQSYAEEVGKINFKRLDAVGDLRTKHITPKDTEIQQISVRETNKIFKKYFLANQFRQSAMQEQSRTEDVIKMVLDEHQRQMDELFLLGEGTSTSTMLNNGLFWSNDPNYDLEGSATVNGDGVDPLIDLHAKVIATKIAADRIAGRKLIIFYGDVILPYFNGLYASYPTPFKETLQTVLGPNYQLAQLQPEVTPSGENGWICVNLDQVLLHYTTLPALKAQGVNDEKMYSWHNFMMGSTMLEVLVSGAVIRQPATVDLGT